jgi:protein arginine kinase
MDVMLNPSMWMEGNGQNSNVVLSSRIRLARNLSQYPFPQAMKDEQKEAFIQEMKVVISQFEAIENQGNLSFFKIDNFTPLEKQVLVEKHLVSPQFIGGNQDKAIILSRQEEISIMVNEEDHLRIQVILPAMNLKKAYEKASKLDDALEQHLDYAFSEDFGYLTSCPTNVGTGLRASVMMHLSALVLTKQVDQIFSALAKVGLTVRGLYGEGSKSIGDIFQISNQVTLGQSEEEILANMEAVCGQIIEQELRARNGLSCIHG